MLQVAEELIAARLREMVRWREGVFFFWTWLACYKVTSIQDPDVLTLTLASVVLEAP